MSLSYDLHSHSSASDGCFSPTELVQYAQQHGVDVLALTDHDITSGISEAKHAAENLGLKVIAGVEISVIWRKQTLHILGLNIDSGNVALLVGLEKIRQARLWRAQEMGRRLDKAGLPNMYEAAKAIANGENVTRTHFARILIAQGHAKDMKQVFKRFIVPGKPGYVAGDWAEMAQALEWIKNAGGTSVIAHPARYKLSATKMRMMIDEFMQAGGEGIEVISGSHSKDESQRIAALARQYNLLASRGSDFHDPAIPYINMQTLPPLPSDLTPVWDAWQ
ncbi:FIG00031715: Predicted metal-dependent phosphoesterases (PHP family) [hydrothermal vent metagenome]|uniref:FIG00031715: Predicted metal-dependent phosphoesterases (PHP family) n=1 Tax=hydrothermal vent metagenome TaxID=652676 RepID=A0A3B0ZUD6_9ZZZZ